MKLQLKKEKKPAADAPRKRARVKLGQGKKAHFTLFVGDDGAILVYAEGKTVVRRLFAPSPSPDHTKTMLELLNQHPGASVSMLMDVMDQQYVRQNFPPVSSLSVGGLAKRRLGRDFAADDLTGAINMGREETARKDWMFMLVALTSTALFKQWFELIAEQPNRFLGVYLVPLESEKIIPAIASAMPQTDENPALWQLLVSHNKVSGFRIVVLRDGMLTFSRVGQGVGEDSPQVVAGNIEQEIQNTVEYLRRLAYTEADGLEVFVISAAEVRDVIDAKRINARKLNLLSPYDVAELLELKQAALSADRFGDVVLAAAFALVPKKKLTLKPVYAKKLEQMVLARVGMRAGAALIAAVLLLSSLYSVFTGFSAGSAAAEIEQKASKEAVSLVTFRKQVENLGKDANMKSDIAIFYNATAIDQHPPLEVLDTLTKLARENVQIKEWEWLKNDTAAPADAGSKTLPVTVRVVVRFLDEYPDDQAILEALSAYKLYVSQTIKDFDVDVPIANLSGAGKVSVALQNDTDKKAEAETAPELTITLKGPMETPVTTAAQGEAP